MPVERSRQYEYQRVTVEDREKGNSETDKSGTDSVEDTSNIPNINISISIKGVMKENTNNQTADSEDEISDDVFCEKNDIIYRGRIPENLISVTVQNQEKLIGRQRSARKKRYSDSDIMLENDNETKQWCTKEKLFVLITFVVLILVLIGTFTYFLSRPENSVSKHAYDGFQKISRANFTDAQSQTANEYSRKPMLMLLIGGEREGEVVSTVQLFPTSQLPNCEFPSLREKLRWGNAGFVNDDLLVCGGETLDQVLSRHCWALDSNERTWRPLDNLTRYLISIFNESMSFYPMLNLRIQVFVCFFLTAAANII